MKLYTKEETEQMKAGTYEKKRQFPLSEIGQVLGGKFIEVVEREGTDYNRKFLRLETEKGIQEIFVNTSLEQELNLKEPEVSQYLEIAFVGKFQNPRGGNPLRLYEIRLEEIKEEATEETEEKEKTEETDKSEKKNPQLNDEKIVSDLLDRLKAIPEDLRDGNIVEDTIEIHCTLNRLAETDAKRIKEKVLKAFQG